MPSSESDEGLEYLAQKLQDKMLKFRTTLSPAKLLKIIKETKAEVREAFDDLALYSLIRPRTKKALSTQKMDKWKNRKTRPNKKLIKR